MIKIYPIEHSENKIITYFENEVGPAVLPSSAQRTYTQNHTERIESIHNYLHVLHTFGILAVHLSFIRWAGALQVQSRFQTVKIAE